MSLSSADIAGDKDRAAAPGQRQATSRNRVTRRIRASADPADSQRAVAATTDYPDPNSDGLPQNTPIVHGEDQYDDKDGEGQTPVGDQSGLRKGSWMRQVTLMTMI